MAKKKRDTVEFEAQCTLTIIVEAKTVEEAEELIQAKLDSVGLDGTIDDLNPDSLDDEEDDEDGE